jgi:polycystin 1L2
MAVFFALIIRRDDDELIEDSDDIFLEGDEEYLHAFDDGSLLTFRSKKSGHIPLTQGEIAYARDKRLNEIKMWEIVRELIAYMSFLWILYVVSYSNRDPNAYYLMNHLREDFLNLGNQTNDFTTVKRVL